MMLRFLSVLGQRISRVIQGLIVITLRGCIMLLDAVLNLQRVLDVMFVTLIMNTLKFLLLLPLLLTLTTLTPSLLILN